MWITPLTGGLIKNVNFGTDRLHKGSPIPLIASVEINDKCNQHCPYCFLSKREKTSDNKLNFGKKDRKDLLNKCAKLGVEFITISGMEPLLDDDSVEYLRFIDALKVESNQKIKYGFNTNGINIGKYLEVLKELKPDWITISIDGLQNLHDSLRGDGSFNLLDNNVKKLLEIPYFRNRLEVSTTVVSFDEAQLFNLSKYLQEIGIKYHSIIPIIEKSNSGGFLQPDSKKLIDSYILKSKELNDLQLYFILVKNSENKQLLDSYHLEESYKNLMDQDCFNINNLPNIHILSHNPTRYFRVTSDGYLLRGVNLFDENYRTTSMGRLTSDTLPHLIKKALKIDGTLDFYKPYFNWLN